MTTPSPPAMDVGEGAAATAICNAVVGALKQSCGKGPTKAKAYPLGDHVAVVVGDTLTTLERTLVRKGHANLVREARQVLGDEVAEACRAPIEEATGKRVVGWLCEVDPNADRTFALIRLEPLGAAGRRNGRAAHS